jgi:hypothetical protein
VRLAPAYSFSAENLGDEIDRSGKPFDHMRHLLTETSILREVENPAQVHRTLRFSGPLGSALQPNPGISPRTPFVNVAARHHGEPTCPATGREASPSPGGVTYRTPAPYPRAAAQRLVASSTA